jgi:PPP family 3-phenylpropionic acid transporter
VKKAIPFAFNFVYYAGFAFLAPFMVLYYQEQGFSGTQISLIAGIAPLITLFFSPFWTNVADATRKHRLIMSLCLVVVIAVMAMFPFIKAFALIFLIVLLFNLFVAPITSFVDSATMTMLAAQKEMYGRIRLGGTIGWGLAAPVAGVLIERYGLKMAFWGCAVMLFLGLLVGQGLLFGKREAGTKTGGDFRVLLVNPRWIPFLALAFIGGIAFASIVTYYSPYMKELGATESLIGIALLVSTLSEIPVFFFGNRLIRGLKSYGLLIFALVITGVRSLLFAAATTPMMSVFAQLLNGLTFPAMWVAGVSYADEHAPDNLKSTAQGLFGAMTFGFGSAVGGFMGGVLLESIGGRALFLVYGVVVLFGVAIITIIEKRSSKQYAQV